jgi:hypothetical protein
VKGNTNPPASLNGLNTGLDLKLVQLGILNLTRQSASLASPPKALTALIKSPIASPPAGKFNERMAEPMPPSTEPMFDNAEPNLAAVLTAWVAAPKTATPAPSLDCKFCPDVNAIMYLSFWYIIYLTF